MKTLSKSKAKVSFPAVITANMTQNSEVLSLESETTIEYFRLFSVPALKQYLSVRKKSLVGSFETLVAR